MTSTVDIDKRLERFVQEAIYLDSNTTISKKKLKHLIREVAEEVITTPTKRAMNDYENGWNDCVETCNENLNKILGEK